MVANILRDIFSSDAFEQLIPRAVAANEWFSESDIGYAVQAIKSDFLTCEPAVAQSFGKIGIVCAGNIPLVGFGDMYAALLSGAEVWLKPSRRDILMHAFSDLVHIVDTLDELEVVDEIFAMGSDETCGLLQAKFPNKRLQLQGSRHSIAIIDGSETNAEIEALSDDIFRYCGMGCRSVSHIYLPFGYDIQKLAFAPRPMPAAWFDAYRYARAVATINDEKFIDCGFYILKQSSSPAVAEIGYSFYDDFSEIDTSACKCVISHSHTAFGRAQHPLFN